MKKAGIILVVVAICGVIIAFGNFWPANKTRWWLKDQKRAYELKRYFTHFEESAKKIKPGQTEREVNIILGKERCYYIQGEYEAAGCFRVLGAPRVLEFYIIEGNSFLVGIKEDRVTSAKCFSGFDPLKCEDKSNYFEIKEMFRMLKAHFLRK